ncbi:hypothetical protein [Dactylosporangium sp. NPDC005555]|uniref:hypothetical protein n=1 Tax=Dactylosporangium sp. NPDC005555 TaxID=3154889 RepID=UPI0033AA2A41
MAICELLLDAGVAAQHGRIRLSVTGVPSTPDLESGPHDVAVQDRDARPPGAVSGAGTILVATWADDRGPVAVQVYDGRPDLTGWTLVHTAELLVGTDGIDVGTTDGAVDHWVPAPEGPTTIEVWVHDPADRGEVTFVLSP